MKRLNDKINTDSSISITSFFTFIGLSYLMTFIIFLFLSIILCFTDFPETMITSSVVVTTIISIMFGATCVSRKARTKGWLNGAIAGLAYMLILYLLSSLTVTGFRIDNYVITMMLAGIAAGAVGGIVGINLRKR